MVEKEKHILPIVGGVGGGLAGLTLILVGFHSAVFSIPNAVMIGAGLGSLYGVIYKRSIKAIVISTILGGGCGVHPVPLTTFAFGGPSVLLYLLLIKISFRLLWLLSTGYAIFMVILTSRLDPTAQMADGIVLSLVPFLNVYIVVGAGGAIGYYGSIGGNTFFTNSLNAPYFAVPLLSLLGCFIGYKVWKARIAMAAIKATIHQWEAEGYDVSKFKNRWGKWLK